MSSSITLTFSPAYSYKYPQFTIEIDPDECENVAELRTIVARKYYVNEEQVMLILRGRVLNDEIGLEKLALKNGEVLNISIDCPQEQQETHHDQKEEEIEQIATPQSLPSPNLSTIKTKSSISHHYDYDQFDKQDQTYAGSIIESFLKASHGPNCKCHLKGNGHAKSMLEKMARMMGSDSSDLDYQVLRKQFSKELTQLKEMGFANQNNEEKCLRQLYLSRGDINSAVYYLTTKDYD